MESIVIIIVILLFLAAFMLIRTARSMKTLPPVEVIETDEIDVEGAAERLSKINQHEKSGIFAYRIFL